MPVGFERPVPFRDQLVAPGRDLAHLAADVLGHEERAVRIPAVELLREADLVLAQRLTVGLLAVLAVR